MKNLNSNIVRECNNILDVVKRSELTSTVDVDYTKEEVIKIEMCNHIKAIFIHTDKLVILVSDNNLSVDYFSDNGEDFIDTVDHMYDTTLILGLIPKEEQPRLTVKNYIEYDLETVEPIDVDAVRDMEICMVNDRQCCTQFKSIIATLAKKLKADSFDEHKAVKAFYNRVCAWLERNEYSYNKDNITVHDRLIVAYHLLQKYEYDIQEQAKHKNITEVRELWRDYKREFLQDIKKDIPALKLEFTYFIDRLCKDNEISAETYNNIGYR